MYSSRYRPVPWSEIADKLEPKRNLTVDQAKTLANQTTQLQVSQFMSQFSAALGIGPPTRTSTKTTTLKADGTQETTGTKTQASGAVPTSSGVKDTNIADTVLAANFTQGPLAVPLDGAGQIVAETGIYQLAQILDNQITKASILRATKRISSRCRSTCSPRRRHLPYDAYIDIVLMPASWEETIKGSQSHAKAPSQLPAVIVYPLVITDAMETARSAAAWRPCVKPRYR